MFNFQPVEKKNQGSEATPPNILRVGRGRFLLGVDASAHFNSTRYNHDPIGPKIALVKLGFAYDPSNNAVKITSDGEGFVCSVYPSGVIGGRLPVDLLRRGFQNGDYLPVDGEYNVFKLVR